MTAQSPRPYTPAQRAANDPALLGSQAHAAEGFVLRLWKKTIYLAGTIRTSAEADELIATINALRVTLPNPMKGNDNDAG